MTHEPGRELDMLIAEQVMGWVALPSDVPEIAHAGGLWQTPSGERMCPQFSRNIAAAWHVVERMRALNYEFEMHRKHRNHLGQRDPKWTTTHAIFRAGLGGRDGSGVSADDAHAICLAALSAAGKVTILRSKDQR
ncbi:MAG: hypothetical protein WCG26_03030 [Chloroflexales bacterium]